jgi:hypothetical protein
MHEEVITTTSSSKFNNVNSTSFNQNDGTITVSILHPQHSNDLSDYIASSDCSTLTTSQIVPSQSSNDLLTLKEDVSSVIMNGSITNSNDPNNVLILPASETCDSDKNTLTLSHLQSDQVELDLHDSINDDASSREEEGEFYFLVQRKMSSSLLCCWCCCAPSFLPKRNEGDNNCCKMKAKGNEKDRQEEYIKNEVAL